MDEEIKAKQIEVIQAQKLYVVKLHELNLLKLDKQIEGYSKGLSPVETLQ